MRSRSYLLVLFAILLCSARFAQANGTKVLLQVRPADPTDPKQRGKAPWIEATVISGPKVPLDKYSLSTTYKGEKITLKPEKLREYTEGNETLSLALVVSGQKIWIGNDDYEEDESAKYQGVLKPLSAVIDKLQLGTAGPPGSLGMIVSYSTGAEIKQPLGQLDQVSGTALGSQKDYANKLNNDLVQGVTLAISELSKATTARKVVIIIGDGTDTRGSEAKKQLEDVVAQGDKQGIEFFAVVYKSPVTNDEAYALGKGITAKTVSSVDGIESEIKGILARIADRYYLTFPGYDPKLKVGFPWDGKEHDMTLRIDQEDKNPVPLALSPVWKPPAEGGFPWLAVVLGGVGLLLIIIIGVKVFGKKPEEAPAPMPMPVAPMPVAAPEPPKPQMPMKTVMIGQGGDEAGFPIVGWIVALNGTDAYRTQRLKPGITKIGTAPPADIIVNDGFMSTEHCHIQCSPSGFVLIDNNATNGTYVNDKRVQRHELVDNDTITLGKTNFKFKSIN